MLLTALTTLSDASRTPALGTPVRCVDLMVTRQVMEKGHAQSPSLRGPRPAQQPFILSAVFKVTPGDCRTKLGSWLAQRVGTTRLDDSLSVLVITRNLTIEEQSLKHLIAQIEASPIRSNQEMQAVHACMTLWMQERLQINAAYGDFAFEKATSHFEWPVFGSRAIAHVLTPEGYFDECAKRLRMLEPTNLFWRATGETPPVSIDVFKR